MKEQLLRKVCMVDWASDRVWELWRARESFPTVLPSKMQLDVRGRVESK